MSDATTTSDTSTSGTAAERTSAAGDKLWAALHARPGATAEELANDAGIGRSTAAKILSRWVDDATAVRTSGPTQGKRTGASRFAIATPDPAPASTTPADAPDSATGPHSGTDDGDDHVGNSAATANNGVADSDVALPPTGLAVDHNAPTDEAGKGDADVPSLAPVTDDHGESATSSSEPRSTARLAPGALHGMVEDYLRDHPDDEFGPTKIGHDLGRSSGAVSNALERLVASGYAVRSNDRPKRYRLAAASADPAPEG